MFPTGLTKDAEHVLAQLRSFGVKLAIAESSTGGFLAALLTAVPGSSDVFDCGFVSYSDEAKVTMLGVPREVIEREGPASLEVAISMAEGALARSPLATVTLAVTDVAYAKSDGSATMSGTIYLAAVYGNTPTIHQEVHFAARGHTDIRMVAADAGFQLLRKAMIVTY